MPPRGSAIRVRRSLRSRIYAASGLAFFGLGALLCVILPKAYEAQARESLRERTGSLAQGLSFLVVEKATGRESLDDVLSGLESWLAFQDDLESAVVLDEAGRVTSRWPSGPDWTDGLPTRGEVVEGRNFYVAATPLAVPGAPAGRVAVRTTTDRLVRDLENVRWLFLSIFLLGGASFFVLAKYLTQTILQPLEDIRRAARNLADGEPVVDIPEFGDDEIVELGAFIRTLGDNRRHSRILRTPRMQELMRRVAAAEAAREDAGADADTTAPTDGPGAAPGSGA